VDKFVEEAVDDGSSAADPAERTVQRAGVLLPVSGGGLDTVERMF